MRPCRYRPGPPIRSPQNKLLDRYEYGERRHRHGGHHHHHRQPLAGQCHRRLGHGWGYASRAHLDQPRGRRFSQHRGVAGHVHGRGHARRRNNLHRRQHHRHEHCGVRRGFPDRDLHRHRRHQRQQLLLPDFYPRQYRQLLGHRGGADGLAVHPQRPRLLFRGHRRLERHRDLGIHLRRHGRNLHRSRQPCPAQTRRSTWRGRTRSRCRRAIPPPPVW